MIQEYSAGGVVFKTEKGKIYWLVAQHSQHKGWVFPKGLIGDHVENESHESTAVREVKEETGVDANILIKLKEPVKYFYVWDGEKRMKSVYYFLMEATGGDIEDHDWEMSAVEWLPEAEVEKRLTYKSDKEAFAEAKKLFKNLKVK